MSKRVLVADDSVTIQKVVGLTFADEDVVIEAVADGNQAIAKVKEFKPDLVLADVLMPGLNGYQVCETIKLSSEYSHIPVVLLVGTFEPYDELEAARVRSDAHLIKPFDTSELLGVFHSLVKSGPDNSGVTADEISGDTETNPSAPANPPTAPAFISTKTRESFLGANMILDIFGSGLPEQTAVEEQPAPSTQENTQAEAETPRESVPEAVESESSRASSEAGQPTGPASSQVIPFPGLKEVLSSPLPAGFSEEVFDAIVERVIRRISREVVREIAWEVVPELAESLIRQRLNERDLAGKK